MATPIFEFDWDPTKAESNRRKHGVSFDEAMTIFADPLTLSRLDDVSGESEERWITMGRSSNGRLMVVVHTYADLPDGHVAVRLISARSATRCETQQYENG